MKLTIEHVIDLVDQLPKIIYMIMLVVVKTRPNL